MENSPYTSFERRRGVTDVRLREGVAHLSVSGLPRETIMDVRLLALELLKQTGVKVDFLKLTADGFTFVVADHDAARAADALRKSDFNTVVTTDRTVISVHCVNIRDEAGIVTQIAEATTASGARIEQMGDSHDCILLVVEREAATRAAESLRRSFGLGAGDAH